MAWPVDNITTESVDSNNDRPNRGHFFTLFSRVKSIIAARGAANGVASLDLDGKVPVGQLPDSVTRNQNLRRGEPNGVASLDANGDVPIGQIVNRHSTVTHYQRPNMTHPQEGGTGGEVSEILFFSAKSKRRPSLIYSMQIIPVCLSIVARRKGVSATRRGGLNWTPISLLVGHPCKLFHRQIPNRIARVESPGFTGTPTAPTQSAANNSTRIATTAFVRSAIKPVFREIDLVGVIAGGVNLDVDERGMVVTFAKAGFATLTHHPGAFIVSAWLQSYSANNLSIGEYFVTLNNGPDNSIQVHFRMADTGSHGNNQAVRAKIRYYSLAFGGV